ncbi:response regulator transcription factor [Streptomyces sp. HNM0574]|uniref:response regulator transcription factor n=1 Tax=Streptomyces sp. HNM0574 TaxID=2714954 RepID=UPI00146F41B1|nr:response regulator transcription factor [Streptomyces sp. HNM0574]NLU68570.1 response regulator transcription factor [Streptomyces sp. HNM0574]
MHVLVVEDERDTAESLVLGLRRHGYEAAAAGTGAQALKAYSDTDLILLDLELPDIDGLEVCRHIREACDTPIIAFTDRGTELDRVLGLQAGSDDCLDKPYGFRELIARIDAVMRRARQTRLPTEAPVERGPLRIDTAMREVWLDGRRIETSRKEFDLLYCLASNPGLVITRRRLMSEIWGDPMHHYPEGSQISRTIDTHVSTLRRKLGSSAWIRTVRGVGFTFGQAAPSS